MDFKRQKKSQNKNKPKAMGAPPPPWEINTASTIESSYYRTTGESTNSVLTDAQFDLGLYKTT